MKIALIAAVCLVLVAIIAAENAEPRGRPVKMCHEQKDCDPDQCCVEKMGGYGFCRTFKREGEDCNKGDLNLKGRYIRRCPCAKGLRCVPHVIEQTNEGEVRKYYKCVADDNTFYRT
ncbi:U33-theraphotoxin-Cg1c [Parasteatoda tepidariorum]|uniref:U33-theraphotoxin-Cg1c n=1 Tax=Parasteatoda tepidariorum TaxID=114398 RepID=UPI0039BD4AD7